MVLGRGEREQSHPQIRVSTRRGSGSAFAQGQVPVDTRCQHCSVPRTGRGQGLLCWHLHRPAAPGRTLGRAGRANPPLPPPPHTSSAARPSPCLLPLALGGRTPGMQKQRSRLCSCCLPGACGTPQPRCSQSSSVPQHHSQRPLSPRPGQLPRSRGEGTDMSSDILGTA